MERFPGRAVFLERVLAPYRVPAFELLASHCDRGLMVMGGDPAPDEVIAVTDRFDVATVAPINNRNFFRGRYRLYWQSGVIEWLRKWDPDAMIIDANPRYLSTPDVIRWMHKRNRPVLAHGLGVLPLTPGLRKLREIGRRRFINRFDGVVAYSTRAAMQYQELGMPAERVFIAYNAVAPKPQNPLPQRPSSFVGPPVVLFVGRITEGKRLDLLIHACAALENEFRPRLRIVGDGAILQSLRELAERIYPSAEFLGEKRGAELAAIFDSADLFVLPGLGGLAIQEAMAHGLPVIVAEGDGTQDDLVRKGPRSTGWNIPAGNLDALVNAMRRALREPARLREMSREAYRVVSEEINVEKMVEAFVGALNAMMKLGVR